MAKETKIYQGLLSAQPYGDAEDILFLSGIEDPLCERLHEEISGKNVTARYWVTEKEATKDQASASFLTEIMGVVDSEFGARYSEITGYLWTDEELRIGGHDLIVELSSYIGKWVILEIDIHE